MTTLGTHPFVPGPFKLGEVPQCQQCPNDAAHAVHDWLSDASRQYTAAFEALAAEAQQGGR